MTTRKRLSDPEYQEIFREKARVQSRLHVLLANFPKSLSELTPSYLEESAALSKRFHDLDGQLAAADHFDTAPN